MLLHLGGRARDLNWELMLDTSASHMESHTLEHLDSYLLKGRSLAMQRPKLPMGTELDKMITHEHNFLGDGSIPLTRPTHS